MALPVQFTGPSDALWRASNAPVRPRRRCASRGQIRAARGSGPRPPDEPAAKLFSREMAVLATPSRGAEATAGLDGRVMAIAGSGLHDRREFNYQFEDDRVRDEALGAVVAHFVADGASTVTATPEGIDLQGTCLSRGVTLEPGAVRLDEGWYSGYLRIARTRRAWSDRTSLPGRPAAAVASSVTRARFSSSSSTAP